MADQLQFTPTANLQQFTLGGSGYTSGSGTMVGASGQGANLPATGVFWIGYNTGSGVRIFKVTAMSTDTATVVPDAVEGIGDGNIAAGETLKWDFSCAALTQLKADIVAASGLVLFKSLTASSSASLDFTTRADGSAIFQSDFELYEINGLVLIPATDGAGLYMQFGTGGGPTYDTGSNYYGSGGASVTTQVGVLPTVTNTSPYGHASFTIRLYAPQSTLNRQLSVQGYCHNGSIVIQNVVGYLWANTSAMTAFKVYFSSGNIASGKVSICGVRN